MEVNQTVKEAFEQLAREGWLGDPTGQPAYCYIRVSSVNQAEDGRTGLPRQIEHCHEVAQAQHLKIAWELLFADDGFTGFEFENRPALSRLREEIKKQPRSRFVVMEHLDRLSRNARWHQGFLLDEFSKNGVTPLFWKSFGSEIERAVLGTIAEEGMRAEISRMLEGALLKAKSGRVTAKRPRFGYLKVDGEGKVSEKARQDTHYALHAEESKIVRWIFESIIREHYSLRRIAAEMNRKKIPTRFNGKLWCSGTIARIVSDPLYKGEFYARRHYVIKTGEFRADGRPKQVCRLRPKEEWIKVSVPPIVSPEEWQFAQEILKANRRCSPRNMTRREWLLSAFCKCAICHYAFIASVGGSSNRPIRYYGCNGRHTDRAIIAGKACDSPYVNADRIEEFVWSKVEELLRNPELFLRLIEDSGKDEQVVEQELQVEYIEGQIAEVTARYERWKGAYDAGVIDLAEYKEYRAQFTKQRGDLEEARRDIHKKIGHRMSKEQEKRILLAGLADLGRALPEKGEDSQVPFEIKRRMLQQLLDCIWIDSKAKTIRFEGVLKALYREEETEFVFGCDPKWQSHARCWWWQMRHGVIAGCRVRCLAGFRQGVRRKGRPGVGLQLPMPFSSNHKSRSNTLRRGRAKEHTHRRAPSA